MVWALVVIVALAVAIAGLATGPIMSRVEQPSYRVERADGPIELRSYGPMITAEAVVSGERGTAIRDGFKMIAGYIFGGNAPQAKIDMTAPVIQQAEGDRWTVRFVMPARWTLETLPAPADPRVRLVRLPATRMLVIRFSGTADSDLIAAKTAELRRYAADHGLTTTGEPVLAFYNPPWTLPLFRRNEIMLALAPSGA